MKASSPNTSTLTRRWFTIRLFATASAATATTRTAESPSPDSARRTQCRVCDILCKDGGLYEAYRLMESFY